MGTLRGRADALVRRPAPWPVKQHDPGKAHAVGGPALPETAVYANSEIASDAKGRAQPRPPHMGGSIGGNYFFASGAPTRVFFAL